MKKTTKLSILIIIIGSFCIYGFQLINESTIRDNEIKLNDMKKIESINETYFEVYQLANLGQYAHGITSGDFNNDSYLDFVVSYATDPFDYSKISIFYNLGDMSFVKEDIYKFDYSYINDLESGDYDNDGDIDLMMTYSESTYYKGHYIKIREHVKMLINNGQGKYNKELIIISRGSGDPEDLENRINPRINSQDFDNDGDIDFILGDNSGIIELFVNDGNASFDSYGIVHDYGYYSWGLCSNDFNFDGFPDLVISAYENISSDNAGYIYINYNKRSPQYFLQNFGETVLDNISRPGYPGNIESFDYDGDKDIDIVFGKLNELFLCIKDEKYKHFPIGFFPNNSGYLEDLSAGGSTSADFNNDGKQDLIISGVQGIIYLCINTYNAN